MKAPGPGPLELIVGTRQRGFIGFAEACWRKYGDTFEIRLPRMSLLVVAHPDAVDHVLLGENRKNYDKVATGESLREYLTGDGLVGAIGETWRRQRRLLAPFFTPKAVRSYADVMLRDGAQLCERWDELARSGVEVDIGEEMSSVTATIILQSMFAAEMDESVRDVKSAIETMIQYSMLASFMPPLWVPIKVNRDYVAARKLALGVIDKVIATRQQRPSDTWPDDMLTRLMRARDEQSGEAMSAKLLRDESITAFMAGHETTARTMTFLWYALATHPEVARKLHDELDAVLHGTTPTFEDLKKLPYTLQVVKEVLRLYPPAPFYSRDAIERDQIGGFTVMPRTIVMIAPYLSHRHPDFWADPERFDPDRWAAPNAGHNRAYHPFGGGQRVCIGNSFSLLETHILVAILAQRFAPRLRPGYKPRWAMQGVLGLKGGLPMRIATR